MRILIRLAGESLPWRFRDSDRLGEWLDARPWLDNPTVRTIRVPDDATAQLILDHVRAAVAAADHGSSHVVCLDLDAATLAADGMEAAVAIGLGLPRNRTRLELVRAAAQRMAGQPTVWLAAPLPAARPGVRDEAEQFADFAVKLVPATRLIVVLTDTPELPLSGAYFDLLIGAPVVGGDTVAVPEKRLWRHYLHRRIAWEAGGHVARALRLDRAVETGSLRSGDDAGLERLFNREAGTALAALSPGQRADVDARLAECVGAVPRSVALAHPLFWSAGGVGGEAPVPWLARSLLLRDRPSRYEEFLRGALLCVPLAQDLLTTCFSIENWIRGRVRLPASPAADSPCQRFWQQYQDGPTLSKQLYPSECPAAPTTPWAFASLGEVLSNEVSRPNKDDWRHTVRSLRNHLAHGHYVGWEAVRIARRLAGRLVG